MPLSEFLHGKKGWEAQPESTLCTTTESLVWPAETDSILDRLSEDYTP